jgi:DNA-binding transcriptional MerR regulator
MNNDGPGNLWTIDELSARVAERLAVGYGGVASGRVRDVPDSRTIRYYTTLGLLDRPAEMRGRTALYGERHLLQLVAIKRLQADGLSLAEIQRRVVGKPDGVLQDLAARSSAPELKQPPEPYSRRHEEMGRVPSEPERSHSFWRTRPEAGGEQPPGIRTVVTLGNGVSLSLETTRLLDDSDLGVIRMAAAPMIELLRLRGLFGPAELPPKRGEEP